MTDWRKNLDARYVSGEELNDEVKGLKKEMTTKIVSYSDVPTFDQKANKEIISTGLTLHGIYKPVILNKTRARFLAKEFGSNEMDNWIGKPFVIFAQVDKRHGYVVAFKKYYPPQISDANAIKVLTEATDLKAAWDSLSAAEKALPKIIALKDSLKNNYENSQSNTAQ